MAELGRICRSCRRARLESRGRVQKTYGCCPNLVRSTQPEASRDWECKRCSSYIEQYEDSSDCIRPTPQLKSNLWPECNLIQQRDSCGDRWVEPAAEPTLL